MIMMLPMVSKRILEFKLNSFFFEWPATRNAIETFFKGRDTAQPENKIYLIYGVGISLEIAAKKHDEQNNRVYFDQLF